jgi:hypothetical protein
LEGGRRLERAALLCGLFQAIVFSIVSIATFISKAPDYWEPASVVVLNSVEGPAMNPVGIRLATGGLGLIGFLLHPLHLFYASMAIEGAVRAFAASAFGVVLPTFSLGLIAAIHDRLEAGTREKKMRVLNTDVIQPPRDASYDLHVLSSNPKKEWGPYTGIRFRSELYILAGEETEEGPRPFGYRLRKSPAGNLLVVTCNYDPEPGKNSPNHFSGERRLESRAINQFPSGFFFRIVRVYPEL